MTRIEQLKAQGVRAYIRKPFTPELVRAVIEDIIGPAGLTVCQNTTNCEPQGQEGAMETYPESAPRLGVVKRRQTVVGKVFKQVLEDYAFLFGDVLEAGSAPVAPGPYLRVAMDFEGPFKGSLALAVPKPFGGQVAANVLGLDVDDPQTENCTTPRRGQATTNCAVDALKELLNVTCGNLLTALAGDEPVFDLTVPGVTPLSEDEWRATPALPDTVGFLVEEWPVFLRLTVQGKAEHSLSCSQFVERRQTVDKLLSG